MIANSKNVISKPENVINEQPATQIFKLGIVSGKGGVGKTTIIASIANEFFHAGFPLLICDCDADTPNLSILFQNHPKREKNEESHVVKTIYATEKAKLIEESCVQCKQCIDSQFCRFGALSWDENRNIPRIDASACEGCHSCSVLCPSKAFELISIPTATVTLFEPKALFPVISGEIFLEAQSTGKAVTELKEFALNYAKAHQKSLILVDGPPGIGCPVIASLSGLNYAIVVIEPTTSALHDAERVIQLIRSFRIPFGVIINKADMWNPVRAKIIDYLEKNKITLLGEIPMDPLWPEAIVHNIPMTEYAPQSSASQALREITKKIEKMF